eukprot:2976126-Amphidinium_carterae.1
MLHSCKPKGCYATSRMLPPLETPFVLTTVNATHVIRSLAANLAAKGASFPASWCHPGCGICTKPDVSPNRNCTVHVL